MSNHIPSQGATKPARSTASSAILITTSVVGGFALLGAVASAAFGLRVPEPWDAVEQPVYTNEYVTDEGHAELYADGVGATSVSINAEASVFSIEYSDVEEAVLTVHNAQPDDFGSVNGWTFERDGDELVVDREIGRAPGDTCLFGCGPRVVGDQIVVLTLPTELGKDRTASLEVTVSAGTFTGTGSFDEVDLELNAGELNFKGDARAIDIDVEVGTATLEVADVADAVVSVAAGEGIVTLTGKAPNSVELSAEMGSLVAQLPTEKYRVDLVNELGGIDNRLSVSKDSTHTVTVRSELADVVLKH